MMKRRIAIPVEAAVPAAIVQQAKATHLLLQTAQFRRELGFTLAELLVSIVVVVIIVLMGTQLMLSTTSITRTGHKHIDTDTQARVVFDRMALDFAKMLRRTDLDYFVKGPGNYNAHGHGGGHGWGRPLGTNQQGSDQISFFTQVPGYYPSGAQSPISLVSYRVNQRNAGNNSNYLMLERMGKGLHWNGVDDTLTNANATYPIVFLPQTIDAVTPWFPAVNNTNTCNGPNASCDQDYEVIAPGVFRFEYYYLLKNGQVTDIPWNRDVWGLTRTSLTNPTKIGLSEIEAIAVAIAVIDPAGRALIDAAGNNSLLNLASDMADFRTSPGRGVGGAHRIGDMEDSWKTVVETVAATGRNSSGGPVPPAAAKGIRIYTRYFDLKTL